MKKCPFLDKNSKKSAIFARKRNFSQEKLKILLYFLIEFCLKIVKTQVFLQGQGCSLKFRPNPPILTCVAIILNQTGKRISGKCICSTIKKRLLYILIKTLKCGFASRHTLKFDFAKFFTNFSKFMKKTSNFPIFSNFLSKLT